MLAITLAALSAQSMSSGLDSINWIKVLKVRLVVRQPRLLRFNLRHLAAKHRQ
ncbi:hypothetical protein NKT35_11260 [Chromobacterium sp. IIBBL 290-4]|nr:hypothetical protein [Chromobacterium sp. IIBBL 290-4]UTH76635.1 hypothetical protein NKT35_11260 [Chromobacterium sp. IIBBL 290-4]